jgi:hypothetical protein
MTAPVVAISKALATYIGTISGVSPLTADHGYLNEKTLEELEGAYILVTPSAAELAQETENSWLDRYQVQVVLAQRVGVEDRDGNIDALLDIADAIYRGVRRHRDTTNKYEIVESAWDPLYDPARLRENGLFMAMLTFTAIYTG